MKKQNLPHGFSLVEVTLALGVMSFCFLSLFGLLSVGLTSNQASLEQTAAASVAASVVTDLQSTPVASGTSSRFGFNMGTQTGAVQTLFFGQDFNASGKVGTAPVAGKIPSRYRAAIAFLPPTGPQKMTTMARVVISWPALGDSATSSWPTKASGTFETITALNR